MIRWLTRTATVVMVTIIVLVLSVVIYRPFDKAFVHERTITGLVIDKGIKSTGKSSQKYLVWVRCSDGLEVLEITDSLLAGRFDSSDLYGWIEEGRTYTFTVRGSRVPVLSWYANIYDAEEVEQ